MIFNGQNINFKNNKENCENFLKHKTNLCLQVNLSKIRIAFNAKNKTKTTMETSFSSTSKSFPQTLHFDFDLKKLKKK